jgi:dTMP kinase
MTQRGRLITIEGVDGTGKTTLANALVAALKDRGIEAQSMREPGGVELSERIRTLVKDPSLEVNPRAEALLYAAARAQLIEQAVSPALEHGTWLVLDRFVDSSLAYQGAGRGLGIEQVAALNTFATAGLTPDRTLLLQLDSRRARARTSERGEEPDRLEREGDAFFNKIRDGYAQLAAAAPDRIRVLDASQAPEQVLEQALEAISDLTA